MNRIFSTNEQAKFIILQKNTEESWILNGKLIMFATLAKFCEATKQSASKEFSILLNVVRFDLPYVSSPKKPSDEIFAWRLKFLEAPPWTFAAFAKRSQLHWTKLLVLSVL